MQNALLRARRWSFAKMYIILKASSHPPVSPATRRRLPNVLKYTIVRARPIPRDTRRVLLLFANALYISVYLDWQTGRGTIVCLHNSTSLFFNVRKEVQWGK